MDGRHVEIYKQLRPLTVLRQFDPTLVDDNKFRQLCDDFEAFMPEVDRFRIAVHESGHAIVLLALGIVPNRMEVSTEERSCILYGWESGRFDHGLEHQIDYFAIKIAGQVAEEIVFETAKGIEQDFLEHISVRLLTALLPGDRQRLLDMQTPFSEYEPDDFLGLPCFKLWAAAHQRATALISPRVLRLQELAALAMRDGEVDAAQMRRFL